MIAEGLVIFACFNSTGCAETSRLYYDTHPYTREALMNGEKLTKKYLGSVVIEIIAPALAVATGTIGTIRLNKYFSLQGNKQYVMLGFSKDF